MTKANRHIMVLDSALIPPLHHPLHAPPLRHLGRNPPRASSRMSSWLLIAVVCPAFKGQRRAY